MVKKKLCVPIICDCRQQLSTIIYADIQFWRLLLTVVGGDNTIGIFNGSLNYFLRDDYDYSKRKFHEIAGWLPFP